MLISSVTCCRSTEDAQNLNEVSSPTNLFQMVCVNVNGVVKNLMIPVPQGKGNLPKRVNSPAIVNLHGNVPLSVSGESGSVASSALSVPSVLNISKPVNQESVSSVQKTFWQQVLPQNIVSKPSVSSPAVVPVTLNTRLQSPVASPVQKICLSNAVKEQILAQTTNGQKVTFQLGAGSKKCLIFRNENGKLVGQLFEPKVRSPIRVVTTLDKSGVSKAAYLSPPNCSVKPISPINIMPSSSFAKPLPTKPSPEQKSDKSEGTFVNINSVSPKTPKIVILTHPSTSTTNGNSHLISALATSDQSKNPLIFPEGTGPPSMTSHKLCNIDSVVTLQGHKSCTTEQLKPGQDTLRSLLKYDDINRHFMASERLNTIDHIKLEKNETDVDPTTSIFRKETNKSKPRRKRKKKCTDIVTNFEDFDWEQPSSDFRIFEADYGNKKPVIRKVHDAFVRPDFGLGKKKKKERPKRQYPSENTSSCRLGCIGCKDHVKKKRKKMQRDSYGKLMAGHPEIRKCSVVLSRLSTADQVKPGALIPGETRPALARKSTTKSGIHYKKKYSSKKDCEGEKKMFPCSDSVTAKFSQVIKNKDIKENCPENVQSKNQVLSESDGSDTKTESKSKYLMIRTNAGTFLVPTDSSQPPMVLKGDKLEAIDAEDVKTASASNVQTELQSAKKESDKTKVSKSPVSVSCNKSTSDIDMTSENSSSCEKVTESDFDEYKPLVKTGDKRPAERIQKLKEQLKKQQEEMENARKALESSKNVLRTLDY